MKFCYLQIIAADGALGNNLCHINHLESMIERCLKFVNA